MMSEEVEQLIKTLEDTVSQLELAAGEMWRLYPESIHIDQLKGASLMVRDWIEEIQKADSSPNID